MAGTVFFSVSMSLDGFIAPESLSDLMGQQWMELQQWIFPQRFFRDNLKLGEGGEEGRDNDILRETFERTGASVMGKRMFEAGEQAWPEEAPFHTPVFVVTHEKRDPWERPGGTTCFRAAQSPRGRVARTHTAGGSRASVSMRGSSKPASESRAANFSAAAADVAAVAPGQRGCETRAIRPPGRSRRPMSRSRTVGSGHMPTVLTASAASNGPSVRCRRSTDAWMTRTRPALMAAALRRRACPIITSEWSTPTTSPRVARLARAAIATPGPQPSSRTRSVGSTASRSTAQRLRRTFDERRAIIQPVARPAGPVGLWPCRTALSRRRCLMPIRRVNNLQYARSQMPSTREGSTLPGTSRLLSIGELAERSGVATTALRYYDELGLVRPAMRSSGHRRYAESAVAEVGAIRFFREVGFSLAEIISFLTAGDRPSRQEIIGRKLVELSEQRHRIEVAREALAHGQRCPAGDPLRCSRFWSIIDGQLRGLSLEESHAKVHYESRGAPNPTLAGALTLPR